MLQAQKVIWKDNCLVFVYACVFMSKASSEDTAPSCEGKACSMKKGANKEKKNT